MLSSTAKKGEGFLSPVSCTRGCFQKSRRWKTKAKIETELSQIEKSHSQFETDRNTLRLPFGRPRFEDDEDE
jgi:hypothetical protein